MEKLISEKEILRSKIRRELADSQDAFIQMIVNERNTEKGEDDPEITFEEMKDLLRCKTAVKWLVA